MGIETIIGVGIALASAAGTAASVHQSQATSRAATDAGRDQENALKAQNRALADKKAVADATQTARVARQRQLAMAASTQGYDSTIATSPLGLSGGSAVGTGKTQLGQ